MPVTSGTSGESGALGEGGSSSRDPSVWDGEVERKDLVLRRVGCLGEKCKRALLYYAESEEGSCSSVGWDSKRGAFGSLSAPVESV